MCPTKVPRGGGVLVNCPACWLANQQLAHRTGKEGSTGELLESAEVVADEKMVDQIADQFCRGER